MILDFAEFPSLPPELVPLLTSELTLSEIQALRLVNCSFRYVYALSIATLLADDVILAPEAWTAFPRAHRLHITKLCKRGPSSCIQAPKRPEEKKINTAWSAAVQDMLHAAPSRITGVTVEVEGLYPTLPWHDAADAVAAALCHAPIARTLKQLDMGASISAPAAIQLFTHLPAVSGLGISISSTSAMADQQPKLPTSWASLDGDNTAGPCTFPPTLGHDSSKLAKLRLAVSCGTDFINPTSLAQLFAGLQQLDLDLDLPSIAHRLAPDMSTADAAWKILGSCQQLHRLTWTCTRKYIRMGCGPEAAHVRALRVLGQAQDLVTRLLGLPEMQHLHLPWASYDLALLSRAPARLQSAEFHILEATAAELQQAAEACEQAGQQQAPHGPQQLSLTVADLRLPAGPPWGPEMEAAAAGCLARLLPGLLELTISSPQLEWLDPWRCCTLAQLAAALEGHPGLTSLDAVQLTWHQQQQCTYDQQSRWAHTSYMSQRYVPDGPDVWRSVLAKLMSCQALQSLSLWPPGQNVAPAWAASRACRGLQHLAWGAADSPGRRRLLSICFYPSQQQCIAAWPEIDSAAFPEVCSFSLADAALLLGPGGGPGGERELIGLPLDVGLDVGDLQGLLQEVQEARAGRRQELLEVRRESVVWGYPLGAPEVQRKVQQAQALVADMLAAQELLLALRQVVRKARLEALGAAGAALAALGGVKRALQQMVQLREDGRRARALVDHVVQEVGRDVTAVQLPAGWQRQLQDAIALRQEVGREVQELRVGKKMRWQRLPPGKANYPVHAFCDLYPDACSCPRWHCELRGVTGCRLLQLAL